MNGTEVKNRHKICPECKVEHCSILKSAGRDKNACSFCSKDCIKKYSVNVRYKKGSYIVTTEQVEKMFETKKSKNPSFGEKAKKIREERAKKGISYDKEKYTHWMQDPKNKIYLSNKFKNRVFSQETRQKMSLAKRKLFAEHPELIYSNCNRGFREDLKTYFRSAWEANIARILSFLKIDWKYEAKYFDLNNGSRLFA